MANYDETTSSITDNLKTSTLSDSTVAAITTALSGSGDKATVVELPTGNNSAATNKALANVDVATTSGGNITVSKDAQIENLAAIIVSGDKPTNIKINNDSFDGTVVLGGGNSTVVLTTTKDVTVETGAGDNKITTGSGGDAIVVKGGGDNTVKSGAGDDKIAIGSGGGNTVVDGGAGKNNELSVNTTGTSVVTIDSKGAIAIKTGDGGAVSATHIQTIDFSAGKVNVDASASKTALNVVTGNGADSVNLGSGRDSIVLAGGNDSVNTGAGNDKLEIADGFKGKAVIDGGTGTNELSVSGVRTIGSTTTATTSSNAAISGDGKAVVDSSATKSTTVESLVIKMDNGATINATNFLALVLGDDAVSVNVSKSTSALNVISGAGNDSISLGAGKDSITLSGGKDTINTGAGIDTIKLAADYAGKLTTKLDGGEGNDKLDLSAVAIKSVNVSGAVVTITLDSGAKVQATNIESFVYDSNGDAAGGIKTVGVADIDNSF